MQIIVCIKQTPDTEARIKLAPTQIKTDGANLTKSEQIDFSGIKYVISYYDWFALEEALRLREILTDVKITVLSIGPQRVQEALRECLAVGVNEVVHIECNFDLDHTAIARAVTNYIKSYKADTQVVLMGKESLDDGDSQLPAYTSGLLDWPLLANMTKVEWSKDFLRATSEQSYDGKIDYQVNYPVVVSTEKGLNQPRFTTLPALMKAKKQVIEKIQITDLGIHPEDNKIKNLYFFVSETKKQTKKLVGKPEEQIEQLFDFLKNEAKVLK